jgi:hypothetical protein
MALANDTGYPEKSERTQLTLSKSRENKEKLQRMNCTQFLDQPGN